MILLKLRAAVFKLLLFPFLASATAWSCEYFPPSYNAGKNFIVRVSSLDGRTFAGVRVILVSGARVARFAITDGKGTSSFQDVGEGEYSLEVDQLGTAGWDTAYLKVVAGTESPKIELHWPSAHLLSATQLKGVLLESATVQPIKETYLRLVHAVSGSLESRFLTTETGEFDLGSPEPGLYFVKVDPLRPGVWLPQGVIPVLVEPDSKHDLTLTLVESSCGLMYSEVCPMPKATLSHIEGTLSDELGTAINRAGIVLVRSGDRKTAGTVAFNASGHFWIKDAVPGDYQLRISSGGFVPLLMPITITAQETASNPLDLRLKVVGKACTDAKKPSPEPRAN